MGLVAGSEVRSPWGAISLPASCSTGPTERLSLSLISGCACARLWPRQRIVRHRYSCGRLYTPDRRASDARHTGASAGPSIATRVEDQCPGQSSMVSATVMGAHEACGSRQPSTTSYAHSRLPKQVGIRAQLRCPEDLPIRRQATFSAQCPGPLGNDVIACQSAHSGD